MGVFVDRIVIDDVSSGASSTHDGTGKPGCRNDELDDGLD